MTSPPSSARVTKYQSQIKQAVDLLENARRKASNKPNSLSAHRRHQMREELKHRYNGMVAYEWQLDVAEALLLGLDCSVIAGTGAGKTVPFVLPLFVETEKVVIIISPLNALEEDQAARFQEMELSAVAVNGETYCQSMHKDISDFKYQVVVTSPEMCLEHDLFRQLLSSTTFAERICAIVVDEAHCISQWGDKFRPLYAQLGTLRAFVAADVPFLISSATLPPHILTHVHRTMHMAAATTYHLNLGTDRPNISWFVQMMNGGKSDLESLTFLIPKPVNADDPIELTQTMVFFDDINLALQALGYLRRLLPQHLCHQIAVYNSRRSRRSKKRVLKEFREGKIVILLTTEAAGMGCDISTIKQVVQFMVPSSLSVWIQRAGRAGRNRTMAARAILLVQPSVFQEMKKSSTIAGIGNNTDSILYRKTVEDGLREWIETKGCRRDIADKYFADGKERSPPTGACCDNCLRKISSRHPLLNFSTSIVEVDLANDPTHNSISDNESDNPADDLPNLNGKRAKKGSVGNRRDNHLQGARELLEAWRYETWMKFYSRRPWGMEVLLPNTVLTVLATKARINSLENLRDIPGWGESHLKRHGEELINILKDYDSLFKDIRDAENHSRAIKKKTDTAARQKAKREAQIEERSRQRELHAAQPKTPRPSRAKLNQSSPSVLSTTPIALSNSHLPNIVCTPVHPATPTHTHLLTDSNRENLPPPSLPYPQPYYYYPYPYPYPVYFPSN